MTLLFLLASLGAVLGAVRRLGWPGEAAPLAVFSSLIVLLYAAGLAGALTVGLYVYLAVGLVMLTLEVRCVLHEARLPRVPRGALVYWGVVGLAMVRLGDAQFIGWDVFSHWGLVTKDIVSTAGLVTAGSPVMFKDYPPGSALFHFAYLGPARFSEAGTYQAHVLLAAGAMSVLSLQWRTWAAVAALVFGYFAVSAFAVLGPQSLEVDQLLALWFGCGVISHVRTTDEGRFWRVAAVLCTLPLLKSAGLTLGLLLAIIVSWDTLRRGSWRRAALSLGLILLPLAVAWSWGAHARTVSPVSTFRKLPSLDRIAASLNAGSASEREREVVRNFERALANQVVGPENWGDALRGGLHVAIPRVAGLTAWQWALVWATCTLLLVMAERARAWRSLVVGLNLWLALGLVVWLSGLLVLYLHAFHEFEGVRLASFSRYVGTMVLSTSVVIFGLAMHLAGQNPGRGRGVATMLLLVMIGWAAYAAPSTAYHFLVRGPRVPVQPRLDVMRVVADASHDLPLDAKVYVMWPGTQGLEFYMARYELAPRRSNIMCWSVGSPRFEGDVWTCPRDGNGFAALLAGYDYLLIGQPDQQLLAEYPEVFEGQGTGTLFRLAQGDPGRVTAQRVR